MLILAVVAWSSGCNVLEIEDENDPNNTELQAVLDNPTRPNLSTLVTGTVSGLRVDMGLWYINHGMIGREMYRFLSAEPRNTGDRLGRLPLDRPGDNVWVSFPIPEAENVN